MLTIQFVNRVDIGRNKLGSLEFNGYKYGVNYLYHRRFFTSWFKALLFLLGYEESK